MLACAIHLALGNQYGEKRVRLSKVGMARRRRPTPAAKLHPISNGKKKGSGINY